jgi:hypothetical protein
MAYQDCLDIPAFIRAAHALGCRDVVIAWRREYGQHPDPSAVRYERLELLTLLTYAGGTIVRCQLDGVELDHVRAELTAAGFNVDVRSRNTV